jgi:hypothetical protein
VEGFFHLKTPSFPPKGKRERRRGKGERKRERGASMHAS